MCSCCEFLKRLDKVVYRTVNDLLQPQVQKQAINIPSFATSNNQSKQIIIQGTSNSNNASRISTLINSNIGNTKSVIVIGGQNQQNNAANNFQYIIQQKQQQLPKPIYLSANNSSTILNNIKNSSNTNANTTTNTTIANSAATSSQLQSNKIQNILLEKSVQQNKEVCFICINLT